MTRLNEFDQSLAGMRDSLPRIWFALYMGCKEAGFTEDQAMSLVNTFILSHNPNGIRPNQPYKKPEEE